MSKLGSGLQRESKKIGFGQNVTGMGNAEICKLFAEANNAPTHALQTVASTKITFTGPVTAAAASKSFGATIKILNMNESTIGPSFVQSTPGLEDGEFQTFVFVCSVGVKMICDPLQFTAQGGSVPIPEAAAAKQATPNAFTVKDLTALGNANLVPATYEHGWWLNRAMWYLVQGYNLRWTYGSLINLLDEELRQTAYMPPGAVPNSAGSSDVDLQLLVRQLNDYYQNQIGSLSEFTIIDTQRLGMTSADGVLSTFSGRPSRDFELASAMVGGQDFHSALAQNRERRTLACPYIIKPGVKTGISFEEQNEIYGNLFRAWLSADNGLGGTIPSTFTEGALISSGATTAYNEQSLDSPAKTVSQTNLAQRAVYKGGSGGMAIEFSGFEMTDDLGQRVASDPVLQGQIKDACGACCGWAA